MDFLKKQSGWQISGENPRFPETSPAARVFFKMRNKTECGQDCIFLMVNSAAGPMYFSFPASAVGTILRSSKDGA